MIAIRRARVADAVAIGAVHVAAWRSAYPGILPDNFLARMSVTRQAAYYERAIASPAAGVYVAVASGDDLPAGAPARVVGFATAGRRGEPFGDGEIETLYVLDDWRDHGIGSRLLRAAAGHLAEIGCRSAFLWVLRDNPSRWFYAHLGGQAVCEDFVRVAGQNVLQTAYAWNPIERLLQSSPQKT